MARQTRRESKRTTCTHLTGDRAKRDEVDITIWYEVVYEDGEEVRREMTDVSCPFLSMQASNQWPATSCGNYTPPSYGKGWDSSCTYDHVMDKKRRS